MRVFCFLLKHTSSLRSGSMSCRFDDTCGATWLLYLSLGVDRCAGGDRSPRQVQDTRCDSDRITSPCKEVKDLFRDGDNVTFTS